MRITTRSILNTASPLRYTFVAILAMFLVSTAASAQGMPQQAPPQPDVNIEVNSNELETVAEAYVEVQDLLAEYQAQFGQVQDPDKAKEIQQQLQSEANAAIESRGLEVERFDRVIKAANADADLRDRLMTRIEAIVAERQADS